MCAFMQSPALFELEGGAARRHAPPHDFSRRHGAQRVVLRHGVSPRVVALNGRKAAGGKIPPQRGTQEVRLDKLP